MCSILLIIDDNYYNDLLKEQNILIHQFTCFVFFNILVIITLLYEMLLFFTSSIT